MTFFCCLNSKLRAMIIYEIIMMNEFLKSKTNSTDFKCPSVGDLNGLLLPKRYSNDFQWITASSRFQSRE